MKLEIDNMASVCLFKFNRDHLKKLKMILVDILLKLTFIRKFVHSAEI